ncbi:MAG: hypothetical protein WBD20_16205 [Pirellulaceae bacterium]
MFDKIAHFDLAKLTLVGWLLFLSTTGLLLAACFLLAFEAEDLAEAALENRMSQRILGVIMIAASVAFFAGMRKLLEKFGVTIYRSGGN